MAKVHFVISTYMRRLNETGFLVKEFDYEAMAEKIIKLLLNPNLAEQMGQAGRKNISQLCQMSKRVESIYDVLTVVSKKNIR